jgi:hypothetical protein
MIAEAAIFKVRVTECFCGSQSLLWVEFQHLREEVYSFVGSIAGQTIELMQIALQGTKAISASLICHIKEINDC